MKKVQAATYDIICLLEETNRYFELKMSALFGDIFTVLYTLQIQTRRFEGGGTQNTQ